MIKVIHKLVQMFPKKVPSNHRVENTFTTTFVPLQTWPNVLTPTHDTTIAGCSLFGLVITMVHEILSLYNTGNDLVTIYESVSVGPNKTYLLAIIAVLIAV